ncbi:MAG: hemolysin III family protein [Treponemataceae bacterium]|nr:hemolysin III family protein [Treponemataceae bacterium]
MDEQNIVNYELTTDQKKAQALKAAKDEYAQKLAELKQERDDKIAAIKGKHREAKDAEAKLPPVEKVKLRQKEAEARKAEYLNRKGRYTIGEEIFNAVSHGVGAGLAVAALVLLVWKALIAAPESAKSYYIVGFSVFGASMVLYYLTSTLYHAIAPTGAKKVFGIFNHDTIYILIAGTYTPFCLSLQQSVTGWVIFGIVWLIAVLGVVFYSVRGSRMRTHSIILYLMLIIIMFIYSGVLSSHLPKASFILLLTGSGVYVLGMCFYAMKGVKWMHSIWHLICLAGSILHFFAVMQAL